MGYDVISKRVCVEKEFIEPPLVDKTMDDISAPPEIGLVRSVWMLCFGDATDRAIASSNLEIEYYGSWMRTMRQWWRGQSRYMYKAEG